MKRFLYIFLFAAASALAQTTITSTLDVHSSADNGSVVTATTVSVTFTPTAGDGIVCEGQVASSNTLLSVADNQNGTYSIAAPITLDSAFGQYSAIYYKSNVKGASTTVTLTAALAQHWSAISCQAFKPSSTANFNLDSGFTQIRALTATANPTTGSTITPSHSNSVIIGYLISGNAQPTSAGTNYTIIDGQDLTFGEPEYWIQTTATATNAPYVNISDDWIDSQVAFYFTTPPVVMATLNGKTLGSANGSLSSLNGVSVSGIASWDGLSLALTSGYLPLSFQIAADNGDGYVNDQDSSGYHSTPQFSNSDLVGWWSGVVGWVTGYDFPAVNIAKGTSIQSAYLKLYSSTDFSQSGPVQCSGLPCPTYQININGATGVVASTPFSGTSGNSPDTVTLTTSQTAYYSTGPGDVHGSCSGSNSGIEACVHYIDVTNEVQEMVNQSAWTTASDLRFVMSPTSNASNVYVGYADYNNTPTKAPTLLVNPSLPLVTGTYGYGTDAQPTYPTVYAVGSLVYPANASHLFLFLADYSNFKSTAIAQPTLSDSCGNTWSILAGPNLFTGVNYFMRGTVYYVTSPVSCPAGDTVTFTAAHEEPIFVHYFAVSGASTTVTPTVGAFNNVGSSGSTSTSATTNTVTFSGKGGLMLSWLFGDQDSATTVTPGSGFSLDPDYMPTYLAAASQFVSSAGTYSASYTLSSADGWMSVLIGLQSQ